ncbi:replication restart DNA helicase PriA [Actinocorallia herbida]|uniref:Probable replication restart protein PriA n=1 Tax=Actinocorallia herbida TaxID=58109 RepID=A0A3N1CT93_9ACTN|nr:primosomal protein N' [Actinocorallia herbida]ROO83908.1 replication restart DNA helicase PriA [Actinocorallia herbida]
MGEDGLIPGTEGLAAEAAAEAAAVRKKAGGKQQAGVPEAAAELPVARIAVDVPLPHLDRVFDYLVPARLDAQAVPGCRVRVRFHGKLLDGFLLERVPGSEHEGRLLFLERVVSPEPVLGPEIAALAREVADRYAGTFADVVRLAVPPRHARAEKRRPAEPAPRPAPPADPGPWAAYPAGPSYLAALAEGRSPRAVWTALPGPEWPAALARAARATAASGRGALIIVADGRQAARVAAALTAELSTEQTAPSDAPSSAGPSLSAAPPPDAGAEKPSAPPAPPGVPADSAEAPAAVPAWPGELSSADAAAAPGESAESARSGEQGPPESIEGPDGASASPGADAVAAPKGARAGAGEGFVVLRAEDGPERRYGEWLRVERGEARIVVGTRAAMFAPVRDLGLVVLWDDGDDVHAEPHAPYPHAREVLVLRAHRAGAGALFGGITRTADTTRLVETGWAHPLTAARETIRAAMPRVRPAGDDAELARDEAARTARLPALAFRAARAALAEGPVLVQVPRRGYLPALACAQCREPARCPACAGPLALGSAGGAPACRWCGAIAAAWRCPECGGTRVRAVVVGAGRTAEELGRAFPGVTVRTSGRDAILTEVSGKPELVVATPGAEPVAEGGYAAALLLDGWAMLGRPDLRVAEEALRRWLNAAALVRPHGAVVLAADGGIPAVQAAVRWDPVTFAERELDERRELHFPPVARMASLTGPPAAIRDLIEHARLPEDAELLGPVPHAEGRERALLRVPRTGSTDLARALKEAQSIRSARRAPDPVRVELDPLELL